MDPSTTKLYALVLVALVVSFTALGLTAYEARKIGGLLEEERAATRKLDTLSSGVDNLTRLVDTLSRQSSSRIAAIRAEVESVKSVVSQLLDRVESLKSTQEGQQRNITVIVAELEDIKSRLDSLEESLGASTANVTKLSEELAGLEARLDEVYSLLLYPVTVTDATGEPVTIPSKPTRIVSLLPSVTEILWAVNASSQVIAVDKYSNYPPEVVEMLENGSLASIGSGWYPDVERILALRPDLVIGVDSVVSHHTLKSILASYGIPVILLPNKSFRDVIDSILIVGRATGHPAEAARLASRLLDEASRLRSYVAAYLNSTGEPRVRVALVVWVNPLWVAGSETFQDNIMLLAGTVNAYSNVTGWRAVDPESLLETNPDVIIITAGHQGLNMTRQQFVEILKEELGDAVYNITAVRYDRIYFVSGDYNDMLVRPAPRIVEAALLVALIAYPQAFNMTASQLPEQINPETLQLPPIP